MAEKTIKKIAMVLGQAIIISSIVILIVLPFSCNITAQGIDIVGGDYEAPKFLESKVIDENHLELRFSENVKVSSLSMSEKSNNQNYEKEENNLKVSVVCLNNEKKLNLNENLESNDIFIIKFSPGTEIGKSYILSGIVEDESGNTLTFSVPFTGYNKEMPKLIFTKILTENGEVNSKNIARCEFIRLLALEDGNLFGLVLGSVANGPEKDFIFPPIEVKKGEEFTVFLRKKGDGCISELGDELDLAFSQYTMKTERDLWLNNTSSALRDTYDIIYLKDSINNKILEGCMYSNGDKTEWPEDFKPYAEELVKSGIYKSADINDACDVTELSSTKPMERLDIYDIKDKINKGEKIEYPILTSKEKWRVLPKK